MLRKHIGDVLRAAISTKSGRPIPAAVREPRHIALPFQKPSNFSTLHARVNQGTHAPKLS